MLPIKTELVIELPPAFLLPFIRLGASPELSLWRDAGFDQTKLHDTDLAIVTILPKFGAWLRNLVALCLVSDPPRPDMVTLQETITLSKEAVTQEDRRVERAVELFGTPPPPTATAVGDSGVASAVSALGGWGWSRGERSGRTG
jgi:hypothetical protein